MYNTSKKYNNMKTKEFEKFISKKDRKKVGDYVVMPFISSTGHKCFGAFNYIFIDEEYYLSETPAFSSRCDNAMERCIEFAKGK